MGIKDSRIIAVFDVKKTDKRGHKHVLIFCNCGAGKIGTKITRKDKVKDGKVKSCGCLTHEATGRPHIQDREVAIKMQIYHEVKRQHKAKGFKLDDLISFEKFTKLIDQKCYYCGNIGTLERKDRRPNSQVVIHVNGINRLDNQIGFTIANCVACCKECSTAKLTMDEREFAAWINRAYNMLVLGKNYPLYDKFIKPLKLRKSDIKGKFRKIDRNISILNSAFNKLKNDARKHNREFSISREQYINLITKPCAYCGLKFSRIGLENEKPFIYFNTLDRINTMLGYTLENVATCCYFCNIAKGDKPISEFIKHVMRLNPYAQKILSNWGTDEANLLEECNKVLKKNSKGEEDLERVDKNGDNFDAK